MYCLKISFDKMNRYDTVLYSQRIDTVISASDDKIPELYIR